METVKTERLQHFEDNCLLGKPLVCSATYIKNGNTNNNTCRASLLTDITVCNTSYTIDHLWVKTAKKVNFTTLWRSKQHTTVYFIAKFIKITKPSLSLYEIKEDINIKIVKILN